MRRWNGWGFEGIEYPLHEPALRMLEERVGTGEKPKEVTLKRLIKSLPEPKIKSFPHATDCPFHRLTHSYGQSFPDWIKFKTGAFIRTPDLVCFPQTEEEIEEIVAKAKRQKIVLIPYGGGTSVLRHLEPPETDRPVVTVDMKELKRIIDLDENSLLATVEAGITGPELERALNVKGFTCGHFPQSFELSTLGGWIATRSSGQFSLRYGKIEKILQGCKVITPTGTLKVNPYPASASGIELKNVVLGSEGRIGFITEATIRVWRLPEKEIVGVALLPSDEAGIELIKGLSQSGIPFTMLRLSLSKETESSMSLMAHKWWFKLLEGYLNLRRLPAKRCMLTYAISGHPKQVRLSLSYLKKEVKRFGGVVLGRLAGRRWLRDRFKLPYIRNTLWDLGYGVDTLETATVWSNVPRLTGIIERILEERGAYAFSHLSHLYPTGSSIYTTFIFPLSKDPEENYHRWLNMKQKVSIAIVKNGGTISHHHGVGIDHAPYLPEEKGKIGIETITNIIKSLDPDRIMNPGKMVKP